VRKQDKDADFLVQSYDSANDAVVVNYHGQKFNLPLSSSKIAKSAASMPVPVAAMTTDVQPAAAGTPAVARADDQRRLESIAAEVRRRRALREGAAAGAAVPPPSAARPERTGQPSGPRQ
jgi:hypothetical protein